MRDRALVVPALLFLALTIGAGVNTSLEACNKMRGQPMALSAQQIYHEKMPFLTEQVKYISAQYTDRMHRLSIKELPPKVLVPLKQRISDIVKHFREISGAYLTDRKSG